MRTTLHLDDEAYSVAVRHAKMRKIRLGRAISDLIIRGAKAQTSVKEENGLVLFDPPKHLPKITTEQVKRLAEEWCAPGFVRVLSNPAVNQGTLTPLRLTEGAGS